MLVIAVAAALMGGTRAALADPVATQPAATTQPVAAADPPAGLMRQWFTELASDDSNQRDHAQLQLLGLPRSSLDRLRSLVQENRPLPPAQVAALHEIVMHVFLSGEDYPANPEMGSLGVYPDESPFDVNNTERIGVRIDHRIPGFPAYQFLKDGDLVLGIRAGPDAPVQLTPTFSILAQVVGTVGVRQEISLDVLRQGQRMRIDVPLRPRLVILDPAGGGLLRFVADWRQKGEDYWQREFVPLVRPGVS